MNSESAKQRFQEANRLFKNRQYEKALELLQQLNREFPNTENIMYAAALSLEKLGSIDEAKYLCHSMIRNFESVRAQELLNHLEVAPRVAAPQGDTPDAAVEVLPKHARLEDIGNPSVKRRNRMLVVAVVVLAALVLALPFLLKMLR